MIRLVCYYCGYELEAVDGSATHEYLQLAAKRTCPKCGARLSGILLLSHMDIRVVPIIRVTRRRRAVARREKR